MELGMRDYSRYKEVFDNLSELKGEAWFKALVNRLAVSLRVSTAWVSEYRNVSDTLNTLSFIHNSKFYGDISYSSRATVCGQVLDDRSLLSVEKQVLDEYPQSKAYLKRFKSQAYLGAPLHDLDGKLIGVIAIAHTHDIEFEEKTLDVFRLFADKVAVALQKHRREEEARNKELQLKGLIDGIQDLLINFDKDGDVIMTNTAARNHLLWNQKEVDRPSIYGFLDKKDRSDVDRMIYKLSKSTEQDSFLYFPEGFQVLSASGETLEVEGTLNRYELNGKWYFTMVLRSMLQKIQAEQELRSLVDRTQYLQQELEEVKVTSQLIGESEPVKMLWQDIYMVAHTDATVLVFGETGTGKELVSRQIHQISNRKSKPLVSINCGAIPANLVESELFGHVKGAFTGAVADRKGRFELADGGTVFLDEIGELPLEMQVKLLRVIQEQEFEPVGSDKTIKTDVRIVAATNRNLKELVRKGEFREDLYYRLNVFPIEVPALRDREDDVLTLTRNFIQKFEARMGRKMNELSVVQKKVLKSYHWPGNVRELQNIIERAIIVSKDGHLDLAKVLGLDNGKPEQIMSEDKLLAEDKVLTKEEMLAFERRNIIKALKYCHGKVSGKGGAAELMNMAPTTLSSRISALGIRKGIYEKS